MSKLVLISLIVVLGILVTRIAKEYNMQPKILSEHISSIDDVKALFPKTPKAIQKRLDRDLQEAQKNIEAIIAIPNNKRTFSNTAQALDHLVSLSNLAVLGHTVGILEIVSPNEQLRNTAHDTVIKIQDFWVDQVSNNKKIFEAFKAYVEGNAQHEQLNAEQKYFLKETMDDFKRAGLNLPDKQLQEVKELKKELAKETLNFDRNIAQDNSSITVDLEGLKGLDQDFINSLKRTDDGNYILGVDYPTVNRVMENCAIEDTRKRLFLAFVNRAYPANESLLKNIIRQRDELAKKLGYQSYAQLDLDDQMVKNPERAKQFIQSLIERSQKKVEKEFSELSKELPESVTLTEDGKIKPWDLRYIQTAYKKKHFDIDERKIAEYFPMGKTIDGLLDIYRTFLGIDFEEVPTKGFWHEDVKLVKVYNADRSQLLGYLMLDLFPRANKYSHACHAGVIPGVTLPDGTRIPTVSVVIANFPKAFKDKPSLLMRNDVNTFFHEFGHALHAILGATQMASFSGTHVKRDFVELPSQMLEEWLWDKDILKKVSSHYKTGEPLPNTLIDKIIALKQFDSGNFVQTQGLYSTLSLDYFKEGTQKDPYTILRELNITLRPKIFFAPENHMFASFGHLTGYGAKYYGYLWSKVFALDIFEEIKKHGLLNPEIGKKYVREVIGKGGSKDPNELLKNFLGREPNQDAFFKDLGL